MEQLTTETQGSSGSETSRYLNAYVPHVRDRSARASYEHELWQSMTYEWFLFVRYLFIIYHLLYLHGNDAKLSKNLAWYKPGNNFVGSK